ncbi:hypothetical protein BC835DRAFT_421667 [Cytidiella melzeri]|nr:hypothetical protein BC835DRAFT_421667 [Cytidiella melzeri]
MNSTSASPIPPALHAVLVNTFGVVQIGGTASVGLLGVTTLQTWFYYYTYPEDNLATKLLVAVVWIIEFVRSSFLVHAAYHYLVLNWGNPAALSVIVWSVSSLPLTTNLGELFGHLYFAWRIWMLSQMLAMRWALTSLVVILAVWNFGMGLATYIISLQSASVDAFVSGAQKVLSPFALSTAISTDVAIMASLIFLLNRGRSRTVFAKTDRLINTLTFYAIQAGMITVLADVVIIVLNQYIDRIGLYYLGIYSVVGNLYANSLLASLNARASLRTKDNGPITTTNNSSWHAASPPNTRSTNTLHPTDHSGQQKDAYHLRMLPPSKQTSGSRDSEDVKIEGAPVYALNDQIAV